MKGNLTLFIVRAIADFYSYQYGYIVIEIEFDSVAILTRGMINFCYEYESVAKIFEETFSNVMQLSELSKCEHSLKLENFHVEGLSFSFFTFLSD